MYFICFLHTLESCTYIVSIPHVVAGVWFYRYVYDLFSPVQYGCVSGVSRYLSLSTGNSCSLADRGRQQPDQVDSGISETHPDLNNSFNFVNKFRRYLDRCREVKKVVKIIE